MLESVAVLMSEIDIVQITIKIWYLWSGARFYTVLTHIQFTDYRNDPKFSDRLI